MQWVLIFGCVLSSATQFRFFGGLGPGELLIGIYAFVRSLEWLAGASPVRVVISRRVTILWGTWALSMAMGSFWAEVSGAGLSTGFLSDSLKLSLVGVFVCCFYRFELGHVETVRTIFRLVVILLVVGLNGLLVISLSRPSIGSIYLDYGPRFVGWARNPNQIALTVVPIPLLSMELFQGWTRWLVVAGSLSLLLASKSDGAQLALAAGVGIVVIRIGRNMFRSKQVRLSAAIGMLVVVGALAWNLSGIYRGFENRIDSAVSEGGGGGNGRTALWGAALRTAFKSPIVGYGPGSRLEVGVLRGLEAHNVFLDVLIMGGIVAVAPLIWFQVSLLRRAWRKGSFEVASVLSIVVMSLTGLLIRHPLFWFFLAAFESSRHRLRGDQLGPVESV